MRHAPDGAVWDHAGGSPIIASIPARRRPPDPEPRPRTWWHENSDAVWVIVVSTIVGAPVLLAVLVWADRMIR